MKRIILMLAFITGLSMSSYAQDDVQENLKNVIKINPISLAFGNINLSYQRAIAKSSAIQIGANYWYKIFGTEVNGYGIRGSYQFFLTSRTKYAPEGFYLGPQVGYNQLKERETENSGDVLDSGSTIGVGLMLGYQWIWKSGMALDLGVGPMYVFATSETTGADFDGFLPNITIALGFNF